MAIEATLRTPGRRSGTASRQVYARPSTFLSRSRSTSILSAKPGFLASHWSDRRHASSRSAIRSLERLSRFNTSVSSRAVIVRRWPRCAMMSSVIWLTSFPLRKLRTGRWHSWPFPGMCLQLQDRQGLADVPIGISKFPDENRPTHTLHTE